MRAMISFRTGFIAGALVACALGIYLVWLWRPEHQVELHSAHLLRKIESRDWSGIEHTIGQEFHDDWGDDRARLLARLHEMLPFTRGMKLRVVAPDVSTEARDGKWMARVVVEGDNSEVMLEIKQRINSLAAPFELEWQRASGKPWDWKLIRVSNRELVL